MQKEEKINLLNGIVGKITKNAEVLSIVAGVYGRAKEGGWGISDMIKFIPLEIQNAFKSTADLKWKLWDAPHLPQTITKIGLALYVASEVGIIKKKPLATKLIKGGLISSLITPGSGPSSTQSNFAKAPQVEAYKY